MVWRRSMIGRTTLMITATSQMIWQGTRQGKMIRQGKGPKGRKRPPKRMTPKRMTPWSEAALVMQKQAAAVAAAKVVVMVAVVMVAVVAARAAAHRLEGDIVGKRTLIQATHTITSPVTRLAGLVASYFPGRHTSRLPHPCRLHAPSRRMALLFVHPVRSLHHPFLFFQTPP